MPAKRMNEDLLAYSCHETFTARESCWSKILFVRDGRNLRFAVEEAVARLPVFSVRVCNFAKLLTATHVGMS